MKQLLLKFKVFLIISFVTFSCNDVIKSNELCYDYDMIQLSISDSKNQILQIEDHINHNFYNEAQNITLKLQEYDSITKKYIKFIDNIIEDLTPKDYTPSILSRSDIPDAYFFNGENYNSKARNYISETEKYRTKILTFTEDYFLRSRLSLTLNTSDILSTEGSRYKHLNYYLKDMTLASTLAYFYNHKRKVLELENMYLYQSVIDK